MMQTEQPYKDLLAHRKNYGEDTIELCFPHFFRYRDFYYGTVVEHALVGDNFPGTV